MGLNNKLLISAMVLSAGAFSHSARSEEANPEDQIHDLENQIENAVKTPVIYAGMISRVINDGAGRFCAKERSYSLAWRARVGNVDVNIDDAGFANLSLELIDSKISASGFRKGGVLCTWMGGYGDLGVDSLTIKVTVDPNAPENGGIRYKVTGLSINQIRVDQVNATIPFWSLRNGDIPDWLMNEIEGKVNNWLVPFALKNFSPQVDRLIQKGLGVAISRIRSQGFH